MIIDGFDISPEDAAMFRRGQGKRKVSFLEAAAWIATHPDEGLFIPGLLPSRSERLNGRDRKRRRSSQNKLNYER